MVRLVLKRSSELNGEGPFCATEVKVTLSVVGTNKPELNKSFDAV